MFYILLSGMPRHLEINRKSMLNLAESCAGGVVFSTFFWIKDLEEKQMVADFNNFLRDNGYTCYQGTSDSLNKSYAITEYSGRHERLSYNLYSQYHALSKAYQQIEELLDPQLDIVIRARPDLIVPESFKIGTMRDGVIHVPHYTTCYGVNDMFAVGGVNEMSVYCKHYEQVLALNTAAKIYVPPELSLSLWLRKHGIFAESRVEEYPYLLVRKNQEGSIYAHSDYKRGMLENHSAKKRFFSASCDSSKHYRTIPVFLRKYLFKVKGYFRDERTKRFLKTLGA
jgi:hypothetical protein